MDYMSYGHGPWRATALPAGGTLARLRGSPRVLVLLH